SFSQGPGDYFAGDVVFGRPEPSRCEHDARTLDRIFDRFFQTRVIVTNNRLQLNVDADAIEFVSEPEAVGISAVRSKQFGTDGDDFSREHRQRLLPQSTERTKTRLPGIA